MIFFVLCFAVSITFPLCVNTRLLLASVLTYSTGDDDERERERERKRTKKDDSSFSPCLYVDSFLEIQSLASKRTNDCLLLSSSSSLSPVKRLLNESIDSNIEIIQMDEQECILEIVDGVLTIVPKEKSTSSSVDMASKKIRDHHQHPLNPNYGSK